MNTENKNITHKIKELTPELKQSFDEAVKMHSDYTDQIGYIGSLITDNEEEDTEKAFMITQIANLRYNLAKWIVSTFYDEVDEAGNTIDSDGCIVVQ